MLGTPAWLVPPALHCQHIREEGTEGLMSLRASPGSKGHLARHCPCRWSLGEKSEPKFGLATSPTQGQQ